MNWTPTSTPPQHGQRVRTLGAGGREFNCQYFHWSPELKPYYKLIGKVWDHENVTHWTPWPVESEGN